MESATRRRGKEMAELKRLLLDYRVLEAGQICAYFHDREETIIRGMLAYLVRTRQLVMDAGKRYAALNELELRDGLDRKLIASFWALLPFVGRIQYHTRAAFPTQIFFWAEGAEYEIVYVALGDEQLMNAAFAHRAGGGVHYLVVVEQPRQLEVLDLPDVEWFCTVGRDGALQRYIQEE